MRRLGLMLFVAAAFGAPVVAQAVDVQAFVKRDRFETIKISPTGEYFAATVPMEDRTLLMIGRRADMKTTTSLQFGEFMYISDFVWVNNERVVLSMAERFGELEKPQASGELYAVNFDGKKAENLVGWRVEGRHGSHIQPKKVETVAASLVDPLRDDDENVIISVQPFAADAFTRAEKLNVYTGRRVEVARVPVRRADFTTDSRGVVRFAHGAGIDNVNKLYYRKSAEADWELINNEAASQRIEVPLGFSSDDKVAYLQVENAEGPDSIVAMDVATGTRKEILRDDDVDPWYTLHGAVDHVVIGATFMDGKPRMAFVDDSLPLARLYRSLEAAFGDDVPEVTSTTADGNLALIQTYSDRNPGDFYVFDVAAKKASHLISRADWIDPEKMAGMRPVSLAARDGLTLKGYLTVPNGTNGKQLPLVVLPHGGPQRRDAWGFRTESQLLAAAGYAVLQVNFRGSTGYGRAFKVAGAREWGGKMQDDLTDATRWAIQQGIADPSRICIYGGSYGGYAALMGVAKEPSLYKCAVGYVGVYDLPAMYGEEGVRGTSEETSLHDWVGEPDKLADVSPIGMASRIKVPVFLAAGGEDKVAPVEHTKKMEKALAAAGVPVETLYYDREGHGFYVEEHRREYYTRLLAFLGRHLGGAAATAAAPATTAK